LSFLKLFASLGVLFSSVPAALAGEQEVLPTVGVPFACGLKYEVSQAHNTGSHLHNDSWAWDFRMPDGVPIVSASDGVVRMARGDSTVGGCDPKFAKDANYVVVDHGDGFETQYLHFTSVTVEAGQKVKKGELLGYSGKTGWACGSHLHFKVARRVHNGWNNPSVRARIEGYQDLQARMLVTAPVCPTEAPEVIHASAPAADRDGDAMGVGAPGADGQATTVTPAAGAAPLKDDVARGGNSQYTRGGGGSP
jgi:murein DD-endopeptidase MepM/ murein hydrolase activator NlpD